MNKTLEVIGNSFLKPLLGEVFTLFQYEDGTMYVGEVDKYKKKADIQPTAEEVTKFVNSVAKTVGREFDSLNPLVKVVNSPVFLTAGLNHPKEGNLMFLLLLKRDE